MPLRSPSVGDLSSAHGHLCVLGREACSVGAAVDVAEDSSAEDSSSVSDTGGVLVEDSDEDEDGFPKQRYGSGVLSLGPPLNCTLMGKTRPFVDGAGLCSPGRWCPEDRRDESDDGRLGMAHECFLELQRLLRDRMDPHRLMLELACGRHLASPFNEDLLAAGFSAIKGIMQKYGTVATVSERSSPWRHGQNAHVRGRGKVR